MTQKCLCLNSHFYASKESVRPCGRGEKKEVGIYIYINIYIFTYIGKHDMLIIKKFLKGSFLTKKNK